MAKVTAGITRIAKADTPIGALVRLKSGGPVMVVVDHGTLEDDPDSAVLFVEWFDTEQHAQEASFSPAVLILEEGKP